MQIVGYINTNKFVTKLTTGESHFKGGEKSGPILVVIYEVKLTLTTHLTSPEIAASAFH